MTQYRRIEPSQLYTFLSIDSLPVVDTTGPYFGIRECEDTSRSVGYPYHVFTESIDVVLHPDIPDPVKGLLCSALREFMLDMGRDREYLESLGIKDRLRSMQARVCVDDRILYRALLICPIDCVEDFHLSKDLKEIVYNDPV